MTAAERAFRAARAERRLAATAIACVAALCFYATVRIVEVVFLPEPSPAVVLWSAPPGYLWRFAIGSFLGGATGFVAHALMAGAARRLRIVRLLPAFVALGFGLVVVQALIWP